MRGTPSTSECVENAGQSPTYVTHLESLKFK